MTAKVSMTPHSDHLSVKVSGGVRSIDEVLDYVSDFRNEATRLGLRRVLLDYTEARFDMDYHDMQELAEIGVQKDFPLYGLRIAVVCRPDDMERQRLFETIAANRSIVYQVFTDPDKALARLMEP
ncbi:hypothetical protein [Pseudodesulfovibrio methanolicus]|uniref:STAS domain-containing protein n=1 Tax=Pseudodesulfovibrio methanolicus TaxID=3126690 RepID=A0ABZ2IZV1_9BACT